METWSWLSSSSSATLLLWSEEEEGGEDGQRRYDIWRLFPGGECERVPNERTATERDLLCYSDRRIADVRRRGR